VTIFVKFVQVAMNTVHPSIMQRHKSLRIGLLKHLLKMAGLSEDASQESSTIEESTAKDRAEESE
jgi:hypothetical protein